MSASLVLISRTAGRTCALPLFNVLEIMRPQTVDPVSNMPPFMLGLSIIRGRPTPVVALAKLLGLEAPGEITRFISLCVEKRKVAVAVESVEGIYNLQALAFSELPPLLKGADAAMVESVGTLDSQFLMILHAGRILPAEVWPPRAEESVP